MQFYTGRSPPKRWSVLWRASYDSHLEEQPITPAARGLEELFSTVLKRFLQPIGVEVMAPCVIVVIV